jgi:hypothetical protein
MWQHSEQIDNGARFSFVNTNAAILVSLFALVFYLGCAPVAHTPRGRNLGNVRGTPVAGVMPVADVAMRKDIPPCQAACEHILVLWGEQRHEEAELWRQACVEQCERYGSHGQLECYARTRRVEDLKACQAE